MELSTNHGDTLRDPTAAQLKAALDALDPDNGHAVLARSEQPPETPPRRRKRAKAADSSGSSGSGLFDWAFLLPFGLVGIGATALCVYTAVDSVRFKQRAVSVPGQVIELVGYDTQSAVVAYTDATGEPRRITSGWATSPPAFDVGERVQVLHEPDHPTNARIDSFGEMWGTSLFASIFALAFGGVSTGVAVATWRGRKKRSRA